MRTLFLHISSEKTGSTTVQYFLEHIRNELLAVNQVVYPTFNIKDMCRLSVPFGDVNDHLDVLGWRNPSQYIPKLLEEMSIELSSNQYDYIISSEFFQSRLRSVDHLLKVKEFFSKYFHNIKILYLVRDPWVKSISLLSESIKVGASRFNLDSLNKPYFYHSCSVDYVPSMWKSVFDDVSVISISDFKSKNDLLDLVSSWLSFTSCTPFDNYPQLNQSLTYYDAIWLDKLFIILPPAYKKNYIFKLYSSFRRKIFSLVLKVMHFIPLYKSLPKRTLSDRFTHMQKNTFLHNLSKYPSISMSIDKKCK